MNNYLLSVDPSMKNTGFTLWEKTKRISECEVDYREIEYIYKWKPILVKSFNFKIINEEYSKFYNFKQWIDDEVSDLNTEGFDNLNLIIERGTFHVKNGIGYETQEHLRGFIAGQFNKLLTKDMLISPRKWQYWYLNNYCNVILLITIPYKWSKDYSILIANYLIKKYNWNITISNHDQAESLLIGWYYLNKENK